MHVLDWGIFAAVVPMLLYVDLKLFNKDDHVIGFRESLILSLWYIIAGLAFGLIILWNQGSENAVLYYTTYVIEKSLSLDNLFVMSIIFSALAIPQRYQHRVLVWGIIGVLILRGIMIWAGATLIHEFNWVLFIFAAILIYTGIKMFFMKDECGIDNLDEKPLVKFVKKHFPFTTTFYGHSFFVHRSKLNAEERSQHSEKVRFVFTPLFLALVVIEVSDLIFAVDSIPAALAISTDPFIVFTSNVFAVLGLRALFFAVENIIDRFEFMKYALAIVLSFIGFKVFYNGIFPDAHISPALSLTVTLGTLSAGLIFSWIKTKGQKQE
ncbi:MAG: TerC/Alx family metal homeostasis membrane protein [Alphaproteobacteria bacterium]|nr:TerC/Alx family metal homeostasis membrane protein [Alphaproteobacteria bacterium]